MDLIDGIIESTNLGGLGLMIQEALASAAVEKVPTSFIDRDPTQPRKRFDEEGLSGLQASIEAVGQAEAAILARKSDGRYMILSGERRYIVCTRIGIPLLARVITLTDPRAIFLLEAVGNAGHADLTNLEKADMIARLVTEGHHLDDIAPFLSISSAWAKQLHDLSAATPVVRRAYETGGIALTLAIELARQPERSQRLRLNETSEMPARQAIDYVRRVAAVNRGASGPRVGRKPLSTDTRLERLKQSLETMELEDIQNPAQCRETLRAIGTLARQLSERIRVA